MSQKFSTYVKNPTCIPCLRFTQDMDLSELIDFLAGDMIIAADADGIRLYEPQSYADEFVALEEDDILVQVFGGVEVFTPTEFEKYFA